MKKRKLTAATVLILTCATALSACTNEDNENFSERLGMNVKIYTAVFKSSDSSMKNAQISILKDGKVSTQKTVNLTGEGTAFVVSAGKNQKLETRIVGVGQGECIIYDSSHNIVSVQNTVNKDINSQNMLRCYVDRSLEN